MINIFRSLKFNIKSRQQPKNKINRNDKLLAHINKNGVGVEFGPSFRPIAPKRLGYNVTIIDHASRNDLVEKYEAQGIDCASIEKVDLVWRGESYTELTGKQNYYDWIIASHVIEHTTDMVGFLQQCEEILKPGGCLSLAIPDKRYCFDRFRPKTGLAKISDAHRQPTKFHSEGTIAEYFLSVVKYNGQIAWSNSENVNNDKFETVHSKKDCIEAINIIQERTGYLDVHAWTFTPHSFRLLVHDLNILSYIKLNEKAFFDTDGHEFFVTLCKSNHNASVERRKLLQASLDEGL